MRLASIDCKKVDGGYRHSVFIREKGKTSLLYTVKFSVILDPEQVALFRLGPEIFVASLQSE